MTGNIRNARTIWSSTIVMALSIVLGSCHDRPVVPAEIPGVYVLASAQHHDTLELRREGSYVRRYHAGNRETAVDQGRWKVLGTSPARLSLSGFVDRVDAGNFHMPETRGTWTPEIEQTSTGLRIMLNQDEGLYYVKQASSTARR